jgi:L-asparagine transporter-like permease
MKTWGIVLISLGCFGAIMNIALLVNVGDTEFAEVSQQILFLIGLIGLGIYLIQRANKKKEEKKEKEKWTNK